MSCFYPYEASRSRESGEVTFGYHPSKTHSGDRLELPCGSCVGCRMDRSRSWSIRIMHEASLYDSSLFCTFDYAPEKLTSWSLEYRHFQLFLKRLRREVRGVSPGPRGSHPIRFFVAGEYGERFKRPHWHAILFNVRIRDQVRFVNGTSRSATLERLWDRGNVVIGEVTAESAAYCAGYTLSKQDRGRYEDLVDPVTGEVSARRAPFCVMSRRPGIGSDWYDRFKGDLFPKDHAIAQGKAFKVPRYYWNKYLETAYALDVEDVVNGRIERARAVPVEESSERRRNDRAIAAQARLDFFSRRKDVASLW